MECPHCGAVLAARASFCRECGSDAQTGWSEAADTGGVDVPDLSFDDAEYEAFLARELPGQAPPARRRARRAWIVMVWGALAAFVLWTVWR